MTEEEKSFDTLDTPVNVKDKTIESLEEKVQCLEDRIKEERFCWAVITFILFDVFFFAHIPGPTWAGPIMIGVMQIMLLVILGRNLGVDEPRIFVMKFLENKNNKNL